MTSFPTRNQHFLLVSDIADRLQVSTRTVRRWIKGGKLHGHWIGRQFHIAEEDFRLFLAASRL